MSNDNVNMNLDQLLDGTLDDLADLPEFKPFPCGSHRATMKLEVKKIGEHNAVEVGFVAIETVELADTTKAPVNAGDATSVLYFLTHSNPKVAEIGQGKFKELMKSLAEHFGAKSNRDLMADGNGAEVMIITDLRDEKKDGKKTGKQFTELVALSVV